MVYEGSSRIATGPLACRQKLPRTGKAKKWQGGGGQEAGAGFEQKMRGSAALRGSAAFFYTDQSSDPLFQGKVELQ